MSVMPIPAEVEHIASELQISVDGLMQRSVRAFLTQEMRAVQLDIADFRDRYKTANFAELRKKIEQGGIYSHPAWEDAIEWERLEAYLKRLERLLGEVSDV